MEIVTEKTSKQKFMDFLYGVSEHTEGFVGILVKIPGQEAPELIVNLPESMYNKTQYLKHTYNEDLSLIANPEVRILAYGWHLEFEDLYSLIGGIE